MPNNQATLDIALLLKQPMNSWKTPPILPAGKHFYGNILGWESGRVNNMRQTPYLQVNITPTDPGEDVDPSDLDGLDIADVTEPYYRFYVTPKAMTILTGFLTTLGLAPENPTDENIMASRGRRVLFSGSHSESERPGADGKPRVFYNVDTIIGA